MTDPPADPPLRQLTRLRTELSIATAQFTASLFPGQHMLGVEFGVVARVCLPDWARGGAIVRPAAPERAITVRKLASSLGAPAETVRRHIEQLREIGAVSVSPMGVSLSTDEANDALVRRYFLGVHDLFVRTIEDASATCDIEFPVGGAPAFGLADVIERSIDTLLLPIDTFRPVGVHPVGFLLWGALTLVAVRDVTYHPELSRRYANSIPPDAVRAAISLRRLAAPLGVPYATAWRQMRALHAAGLVTRSDDGRWTVLVENLLRASVREIGTQPSTLVLRKIRELALLGLSPARAADHYAVGRPPLAEFGLPRIGQGGPAAR